MISASASSARTGRTINEPPPGSDRVTGNSGSTVSEVTSRSSQVESLRYRGGQRGPAGPSTLASGRQPVQRGWCPHGRTPATSAPGGAVPHDNDDTHDETGNDDTGNEGSIGIIHKTPPFAVTPNLADDPARWSAFDWSSARDDVAGLPDDAGLNMAYECLDRHVAEGHGDRVAIRWLGRDGRRVPITYAALRDSSARFAGVLRALGVAPGERVFVLTGRVPELYTAVLGSLRHRAVVCTLFSAFGPEPIRQRLELGDARVLVTTSSIYRRKVAGIIDQLPDLRHVLLVDDADVDGTHTDGSGLVDALGPLMAAVQYESTIHHTAPDDLALLHFTSGTTGKPKGAMHVHEAIVAHRATARWALDLHENDVFWCTADPGWVTGTSYGILAPLALGVTSVVDEADFDAERW
ncbi:MAG: hypothetical protein EA389_09615, partial [Ilumatobacter sp.]